MTWPTRFTVALLVLIAIFAIGKVVMDRFSQPWSYARKERSVRSQRQALYAIAHAIDAYRKEKGNYPPAYTVDEQGQRLHSWRALILPYLYDGMYFTGDYDFSEAWDSFKNEKVKAWSGDDTVYHLATMKIVGWKETSVFALITPESVWIDEPGGKVPLVDTLLIVEGDKAIHWAAPYDIVLPLDDQKRPPNVPRITPKLKGQGIFTDVSKPDRGFKVEVREYEVESIDELIKLANASRAAESAR